MLCSLHIKSSDKYQDFGRVICFKDDKLAKCKEILMLRKQKNLKYADISLPTVVDSIHGYHHECYRKFTALPKAHRSATKPSCHMSQEKPSCHMSQEKPSCHMSQENPSCHMSQENPSCHMSKEKPSCHMSQEKQSLSLNESAATSKEGTCDFQPMCLFCGSARKKN